MLPSEYKEYYGEVSQYICKKSEIYNLSFDRTLIIFVKISQINTRFLIKSNWKKNIQKFNNNKSL